MITSAVKPLLPLAAEMRVLGVFGTPSARFANPSQRSSVRVSPTSMVSTPVNDSASMAASSASSVRGIVMVGLPECRATATLFLVAPLDTSG